MTETERIANKVCEKHCICREPYEIGSGRRCSIHEATPPPTLPPSDEYRDLVRRTALLEAGNIVLDNPDKTHLELAVLFMQKAQELGNRKGGR